MRVKMILPVPVPAEAMAAFESQVPDDLRGNLEIDFVAARNGGKILDSYYEMTLADAFVLEAGLHAEDEGYDAVCINSMSDSGLNALRSRLSIPVVGPGQACFLTAAMLGHRFSVITMWERWLPLYRKTAVELGMTGKLASVRSIDVRPDAEELLAGKEDIVFEALEAAAREAIDSDGADVIILGSTTMHQSHQFLQSRLDVPVLNPGLIALKQCETLVQLGISHSRRAYLAPETLSDDVFAGVPSAF
ncbi:MAG: aspartate/glutamate racemase family protein [Pseudomonadota bacterium]